MESCKEYVGELTTPDKRAGEQRWLSGCLCEAIMGNGVTTEMRDVGKDSCLEDGVQERFIGYLSHNFHNH